jgi:hypothetical protein
MNNQLAKCHPQEMKIGCAEENPKKKEHATTVEVHYYATTATRMR